MLLALLYVNMDVIWETKIFIFNVFQLFNLHAFSRTADILEKESKKKAGSDPRKNIEMGKY